MLLGDEQGPGAEDLACLARVVGRDEVRVGACGAVPREPENPRAQGGEDDAVAGDAVGDEGVEVFDQCRVRGRRLGPGRLAVPRPHAEHEPVTERVEQEARRRRDVVDRRRPDVHDARPDDERLRGREQLLGLGEGRVGRAANPHRAVAQTLERRREAPVEVETPAPHAVPPAQVRAAHARAVRRRHTDGNRAGGPPIPAASRSSRAPSARAGVSLCRRCRRARARGAARGRSPWSRTGR